MFAPEHLLYPDDPVANPNIRIRIYRGDEIRGNYGACWLSPTQLEDGITHRVCVLAQVSGANSHELVHWNAVVEGNGIRILYRFDEKECIFIAHKVSTYPRA